MEGGKELRIPGTNQVLRPGYKIKLGRFQNDVWLVGFGWYSSGGNRPCCGWYLTSEYTRITKPLHITDLDDVYLVDICATEQDFGRPVEEIDKEIIEARLGADGLTYPTLGESIRCQITNLAKNCTKVVLLDNFHDAPLEGKEKTLYIDLSEASIYIWHNNTYERISSKGDQVESSETNGNILVNGDEIEVYSPPPVDSEVKVDSDNAVTSGAVHTYVSGQIKDINEAVDSINKEVTAMNEEIAEIKTTLDSGIFYEIIE